MHLTCDVREKEELKAILRLDQLGHDIHCDAETLREQQVCGGGIKSLVWNM